MKPEPKFICNRIADKTCTHTTACCAHRIPHVIEEGMTCTKPPHECRFSPDGRAECVPWPVSVQAPVPAAVPKQQPVIILPPSPAAQTIEIPVPPAAQTVPPPSEQPEEAPAAPEAPKKRGGGKRGGKK
jgi:hypothetical protein